MGPSGLQWATCSRLLLLGAMAWHGTLGAQLSCEFGVHVTANQLLAAGADLNEALHMTARRRGPNPAPQAQISPGGLGCVFWIGTAGSGQILDGPAVLRLGLPVQASSAAPLVDGLFSFRDQGRCHLRLRLAVVSVMGLGDA